MRSLLLLSAVLALSSLPTPAQSISVQPVLVELFTSEGCSSCPPADALLSRLEHQQPIPGAQVIALSEHVDYWDNLGWRDRFSSALYTARQNQYSQRFGLEGIYTPQMVVDGEAQFVGSDSRRAGQAIAAAARTVKVQLTLSRIQIEGDSLIASVMAPPSIPRAELYAALVDPSDSTDVQRGENSGRRLQHVSVVRSLEHIGSTGQLAHGPLQIRVQAPSGSDPKRLELIVFAQKPALGPVVGIAVGSPQPDKNLLGRQAALEHLE